MSFSKFSASYTVVVTMQRSSVNFIDIHLSSFVVQVFFKPARGSQFTHNSMIVLAAVEPFVAVESVRDGREGSGHFTHYHSIKMPALTRAEISVSDSKFLYGVTNINHLGKIQLSQITGFGCRATTVRLQNYFLNGKAANYLKGSIRTVIQYHD